MKKKILLMILTIGILTSFLLTSALTAADAAAPEKPAAAPAKPAVAAKPIIIGVPTSLYTPFGRDGLKAVNLAVEEINAKGGVLVGKEKRPFKVVVTDTRDGEPGTPIHDSLMAYEKMLLEQKPHAVLIAPFRSEAIIASMDLVAKYKIPQIHTIAQTPHFRDNLKLIQKSISTCFEPPLTPLLPACIYPVLWTSLRKISNSKISIFLPRYPVGQGICGCSEKTRPGDRLERSGL